MQIILSCEHATNRVPAVFKELFDGANEILEGHRGWDPGSLNIGNVFARRLGAPLFKTNTTRLLVEPNRSIGHPRLFSEFTRGLASADKQYLLAKFYYPHRNAVSSWINNATRNEKCVLHLSIHTFVSELDGTTRSADVGLLYDPKRKLEKTFCQKWQREIIDIRPDLKVRRNYPYLGSADGFTTYLRKQFKGEHYLGIELEVNQSFAVDSFRLKKIAADLTTALSRCMN